MSPNRSPQDYFNQGDPHTLTHPHTPSPGCTQPQTSLSLRWVSECSHRGNSTSDGPHSEASPKFRSQLQTWCSGEHISGKVEERGGI